MPKPETVKVEIELPENILGASKMVCEHFNKDFNQLCMEAIRGDIGAQADGNFEEYIEPPEDTPIMVTIKVATYLQWWYQVYSKKIPYPTIGEFLIDCARKKLATYLEDPKNITNEEAELLKKMLEEAGVEKHTVFTYRIKELLEA